MSTPHERLPSPRGAAPPPAPEKKRGLRGFFGAKETDWGMSLYNFGHDSGLEELRSITDSVMGTATQYMIRIVEQQAINRQRLGSDEHAEYGRRYRRVTFRDNLEGVSRASGVGEGIDVTAITYYKDYELNGKGKMITPSTFSLCGINFDLTVGGRPVSYTIGNRPDNTSFVNTDPGGVVYPDIFPISGSSIPNKLAERYPNQQTAKSDMVRDMSCGSARELELTLGSCGIVEKIYGVSILDIRTANMTDVFIYVVDENPDIEVVLKQWKKNLQLAEEGKI
jgi:hypothetical protein